MTAALSRLAEPAGVAGLMIEDQTWPKRCGHMQGKEVIPAAEMVEAEVQGVGVLRNGVIDEAGRNRYS